MMAQTLQLAFRIAFVWAGGFLLAVAVAPCCPISSALRSTAAQAACLHFLQPDRLLDLHLAALTVTAWSVIRAIMTRPRITACPLMPSRKAAATTTRDSVTPGLRDSQLAATDHGRRSAVGPTAGAQVPKNGKSRPATGQLLPLGRIVPTEARPSELSGCIVGSGSSSVKNNSE